MDPDVAAADLVRSAPVGLGVLDADLRWVTVNPALARVTGRPPEELVGRRSGEVRGGTRTAPLEDAARRVLETGRGWRGLIAGSGADGEPSRSYDAALYPVDGGVGVVAVDATERKAAERRLARAHHRDALLARASQLLGTALRPRETAELVAQLVVPELADWCFVELAREDRIERVAFAHRDPDKLPWVAEMVRRYPLDPDSPVGSPKVIRTGEPELLADVPDALLVQAARDPEHLRILREAGFRSACVVPLVARGRTLGCIAMATDGSSGRRFGPDALPVARALADRCAVALDNAALYAQRDLVAVSLQEQLLPPRLPDIPGLDVAARYSAAGEGNEVGGDFYDVFASGRGWQVVIGDVVGKGPAAAAVTGLARHTLRAAGGYEGAPSQLLRVLNRALLAERAGHRMASVACVRLEPEDRALRVTVSVAGHPLPLRVDRDGSVREVGRFGQLLGVDDELVAFNTTTRLAPGELLVLYTDGVTEARGPGGWFGEAHLRALLAQLAGEAPSRVLARVEAAVLAASGGRPRDDVAMIALRPRPRARPGAGADGAAA